MKQKVIIPKGIKRVRCIKSDRMLFIENHPKMDVNEYFEEDEEFYNNRFTLGKVYNCYIDKSGAALVVKDDNGKRYRASYRYFEPVDKIKPVKKPLKNEETQALNIPVVNGSFMPKESKCKYTNTLNDIHSKIVTYKDYWLFTEVFCLLHDNNDFCNCR